MYIQHARLNDATLNKAWFYHKDFIKGSTIEIELGSTLNKKWGSRPEDIPSAASR